MQSDYPVLILSALLLVLCTTVVCLLTRAAVRKLDDSERMSFESRKVFFAAAILAGLGTIFTEGMILYFYSAGTERAEIGKNIFDGCKTVIPPLVALVIGYFFGRSESFAKNG